MDLIGSMTSQAMVDPEGRFARWLAYAFVVAFATGGFLAVLSVAFG